MFKNFMVNNITGCFNWELLENKYTGPLISQVTEGTHGGQGHMIKNLKNGVERNRTVSTSCLRITPKKTWKTVSSTHFFNVVRDRSSIHFYSEIKYKQP